MRARRVAEGNPLFVERRCGCCRHSARASRGSGRSPDPRLDPTTIQTLLSARLDRLPKRNVRCRASGSDRARVLVERTRGAHRTRRAERQALQSLGAELLRPTPRSFVATRSASRILIRDAAYFGIPRRPERTAHEAGRLVRGENGRTDKDLDSILVSLRRRRGR